MTGIGNFEYKDLINRALDSRTGKKENSGAFGSIIKNINTDEIQALKEKAEAMCESGERFTSEPLFDLFGSTINKDALNKVREQLKKEGIDPSRTPTHEITDELSEKYDFDYLSNCSISSPEFGNFVLDLVYMNVFSFDEVKNMYAGIIPPATDKPQFISLYYCGDPVTGSGAGYVRKDGSITENWEDAYSDMITENLRSEDPGKTESEYKRMTEDFIAKRLETMMIMESFFARVTENLANSLDVTKPFIEDASGKLKEDFGKI